MTNVASRFFNGFVSPIKGFQFLFKGPKLWLLSLVPFISSTILIILGFYYGFPFFTSKFQPLVAAMISTQWVRWILFFLGYIFFFLLLILSVLIISRIFLTPFNSMIAEKVLNHMGVWSETSTSLSEWTKRVARITMISLVQALFFALFGIVLFFLSLIPVVQVVSAIAGLLVVAFDCADYAMELADLDFKQKRKLFVQRLPEFSGLAVITGLTFLVPLLNFFFLPLAVIGASRLVGTFDELWTKNKG